MLALFGILLGCSESDSSKKRGYDIPKTLCGISIDQNSISMFLPPGQEVAMQEKRVTPGMKRCQVNVDGKVALVASQEWWQENKAAHYVPLSHPQIKHAEPHNYGNLFYTGTGAALRAKQCVNPDYPSHVLYAVMQVYASSVKPDASAMKKLIFAYTKEVERSKACRAGGH